MITSQPPAEAARTSVLRVYVTPQEKAAIVALARERGRSAAALMREAMVTLTASQEADDGA